MSKKNRKIPPPVMIDRTRQEWVSLKEAARRIGVTSAALIYTEKNKEEFVQRKKIRKIPMFPWPQVRDSYRSIMVGASGTSFSAKRKNFPVVDTSEDEDEDEDGIIEPAEPKKKIGRPSVESLRTANANKVTMAAALMKLKYENELGNLLPKDTVMEVWRNAAESLKKSLLSIPDRVAPRFGGKDHHKLYRVLTEEITGALANLKVTYDYESGRRNKRKRISEES
jgi:hypothetical protein